MTTPAHGAPLVFPSLAFRPVRLFVICLVLSGVAVIATAFFGAIMVGVFFAIGLGMGLLNAMAIKRAAAKITAEEHPLKKKMALDSSIRLLIISVIALALAYFFRPQGLGVLFGLAIFQLLLVFATSLPVLKALRGDAPGASTEGRASDR